MPVMNDCMLLNRMVPVVSGGVWVGGLVLFCWLVFMVVPFRLVGCVVGRFWF